MANSYDAIVIGSGIGGLTCGAFLSHAGMRVLVLEKHIRIGGYAHSFRRGKYVFDSGIHSVPMGHGGIVRELLTELGVNERVATIEHSSMFRLVSPDCTMALPSRTDDIQAMLFEQFPAQHEQITRLIESAHYFRTTVREAGFDFEHGFVEKNRDFVDRYHNRPFRDHIDSLVTDPRLRYLFGSMWPYIGMSAERAATVFYFMMFTAHFLEGSHYCVGGFGSLAEALADVVRQGGGEVRTKQEVVSLDIEQRRVRAVVTADGERHEARLVVSNVSPYLLHGTIVPDKARSRRWLRRLDSLEPSVSTVGVYLGVTKEAAEHLPDALTFSYATDDHDAIYRGIMEGRLYDGSHLILLRGAEQTEYPTLLLMQFARADASADWKEEKMRVAERMLERAGQFIPDLRRHTNAMLVGSPHTYERYTANTAGALYGFENTASLYGEARMPTRTHLHNLYQVGHWQRPGGGIWNVMVNGRVAARRIADETV